MSESSTPKREKKYASREEQLRARSRRPMTPGEFLAGLMSENGLTQTELAARLQVSRVNLNHLINNKRGLTPDMAHRLARYWGNSAASWLQMQANVQMWDALHMDTSAYDKIKPQAVAA